MSKIPQEAIEAGARAIWGRSPCEVAFDEAVRLSKPLVEWALSDAKVCIEAADAARAQGAEVEPYRWIVEEHLPGGSVRWQCVEHEHHAKSLAAESKCAATVEPLFKRPPAPQPTEREKVLEEVFAAAVYVLREHRSTYDLHRSDLQARGKANAHFYKALVDVCDSIEEGMRAALAGNAPSQTYRAEGGV